MQKELYWRYETNKIAFFLLNAEYLEPDGIKKAWVRYQLLQTVDINDNESISYSHYQNLLISFLHYLHLESPTMGKNTDFAYYRFVNGNIADRSRYYLLAKLMLKNFQKHGNPRLAQRMFKSYKRHNPYPEYTDALVFHFGGDLEYIPSKEVKDFQVLNTSEEVVSLSQYRGKVIYLSFWASWCGPCLKGFRETYEIRKELHDQGVVFLNINLDDEESIWKKTLPRVDVPGTHVFAHDVASIRNSVNFGALPHYVLINKEGKLTFLSSDDLQDAKEDFYKLLKD